MDFLDKYYGNILTIEDQEEALTKSYWAYLFALRKISGSDFKALQAKACKNPKGAFCFAKNIPGANVKYCQEYACKESFWAYMFAEYIDGADIKYCQQHACKEPGWAYSFAYYIPGADKEYCFKHAFPEKEYGKDYWKSEYKKFIMRKACE